MARLAPKVLVGREYMNISLEEDNKKWREAMVEAYEKYKKEGKTAIKNVAIEDVALILEGKYTGDDECVTLMILWSYSGCNVEEYAIILEYYHSVVTHLLTHTCKFLNLSAELLTDEI